MVYKFDEFTATYTHLGHRNDVPKFGFTFFYPEDPTQHDWWHKPDGIPVGVTVTAFSEYSFSKQTF